jgi:hypothetical protein
MLVFANGIAPAFLSATTTAAPAQLRLLLNCGCCSICVVTTEVLAVLRRNQDQSGLEVYAHTECQLDDRLQWISGSVDQW